MSDVVMNGVDGARLILVKRTTRLIVAAACVPALEAGCGSSAVEGVLVPCGPSWPRPSPVLTDLGGICAAAGLDWTSVSCAGCTL